MIWQDETHYKMSSGKFGLRQVLIQELASLRQKIAALEQLESGRRKAEEKIRLLNASAEFDNPMRHMHENLI